jgi:outer membrane lipoprotein SlyB
MGKNVKKLNNQSWLSKEERVIGHSTVTGKELGGCFGGKKGEELGTSIGAIVGGIATLFKNTKGKG